MSTLREIHGDINDILNPEDFIKNRCYVLYQQMIDLFNEQPTVSVVAYMLDDVCVPMQNTECDVVRRGNELRVHARQCGIHDEDVKVSDITQQAIDYLNELLLIPVE
jgi:hypothetical protein